MSSPDETVRGAARIETASARTAPVRRLGARGGRLLVYGLLVLLAIAALMPLYWMFTTSLKGQASYMAQPPEMFPADPTFANFHQLFANPNMFRWIANSLFIALSVTGLNLVFASLAGYAFVYSVMLIAYVVVLTHLARAGEQK